MDKGSILTTTFVSTMKKLHNLQKKAFAIVGVFAALLVLPEARAAEYPYHTGGWYGTGAFSKIINANGSGFRVDLGSSVLTDGEIDYDGNFGAAVAIGYENSFCFRKNKPLYLRLEAELFGGSAHRNTVDVGVRHADLDDTVQLRALFFNGLLGINDTRHTRWWLGGGLGYGQVKIPDASAATGSCTCLQAATTEGLAWRLKLVGERTMSKNTALFGEAGYMKLPGGQKGAAHCYDDMYLTNVAIGLRTYF